MTVTFYPDDSAYVVPLPSHLPRRRRQLQLSIPDGDWRNGDGSGSEPSRGESLRVEILINGVPFELVIRASLAGRDLEEIQESWDGKLRVRGESYVAVAVQPVRRG